MNLIPTFIIVLLIAFLTGSDSLFYLAYAIAALVFLTRFWIPRAMKGLAIKRHHPSHVFFGEQAEVELEITNQGRLPILWLQVRENLPQPLRVPSFERRVFTLRPGECASLRYTLDCNRRGYYSLGPLTLQGGDFLGIAPDWYGEIEPSALIVYPKVITLPRLKLPSLIPFGSLSASNQFFEDPTRFYGVRDYQPGDSLRSVNWTSSARMGRLQVKRFQPGVALHCILLLDLNWDAFSLGTQFPAQELGCTIAASIATHFIEARQDVGLTVLGRDEMTGQTGVHGIPTGRGREHLIRLLELLARARLASTAPLASVIAQTTANLAWGSTVVVITAGDQPSLIESLLQVRRRGAQVVVVAIDPKPWFGQFETRLGQIGVRALRISEEKELDVWR